MTPLQDVAKAALETFTLSVAQFFQKKKKNPAFLFHVTALFLSCVPVYLVLVILESPSAFRLASIL